MHVARLPVVTFLLISGVLASERLPTPLAGLIAEAQNNNPEIRAAERGWKAATHVARQVTTLPDPQFTVQQFSVGSPKPFAGFSNSDFAYIGFGASQTLPYPGKLRLKGQVAARGADARRAQADELRQSIAQQVKTVYFNLAYLQSTLLILERSGATLDQLAGTELSRYRTGGGSQAEVLKAQLEHTKLVHEITMHHARMAQLEADLKLLLHRPQDSPDIVADDARPTVLGYSARELLALVERHNPAVASEKAELEKHHAALQSAERGKKPDFGVGYMFQETGSSYRDYYMLTFNVNLPRRRRVDAEIAEASEMLGQSEQSLDAQLQRQLSEVQKEYVTAASSAELLTEYRDGLIPQAEAVFRANLAAYQSNTGELNSALLALNDVLTLERDSAQALLDHEVAIAHLENLTGETLR
jgi:outer membrane protein, heavy metal efflux system